MMAICEMRELTTKKSRCDGLKIDGERYHKSSPTRRARLGFKLEWHDPSLARCMLKVESRPGWLNSSAAVSG
uniref:Uncharacterized protein n=1 Tax=Ascaris lumbricoides TaxID=6252 RepID=A0A0M3HPV2_ASCLU